MFITEQTWNVKDVSKAREVSAGVERQSCVETHSVVCRLQGWSEVSPGSRTAFKISNDALPLPFCGRITYQSGYIRNPSAFGGIFYGSHRFQAPVIPFLSLSGSDYHKSFQWKEDDIIRKPQLLMHFLILRLEHLIPTWKVLMKLFACIAPNINLTFSHSLCKI